MIPNVGDTVKVWKSVMGRTYDAHGPAAVSAARSMSS